MSGPEGAEQRFLCPESISETRDSQLLRIINAYQARTDDGLERQVAYLRTHGRILRLGVPIMAPTLLRSRRLRQALEVEAETDGRIRRALDHAYTADRSKPGRVLRRVFANCEITIR